MPRHHDYIWLEQVVDKLRTKHQVEQGEVEQVFSNTPRIFRGPKGHRIGENVYYAFGHTDGGRYLFVVYVKKFDGKSLILSARDMTPSERKRLLQR